jgi:hypothetical protein
MAQERNSDMIRVAYYFGRYDATRPANSPTVPPELARLGVSSRRQAIELFRDRVGDGRDEIKFRDSISGDIRYIAETLRAGGQLGDSRRQPIGSLFGANDAAVWAAVQSYIDPELLPTGIAAVPSQPTLPASPADQQPSTPFVTPIPPRGDPPAPFALPDEVPPSSGVVEGAVRVVTVNAYERDPVARRQCIAAHGCSCCVCGFSFGSRYGPVVDGYIHVHHLRPLSEVGGAHVVDPVVDLRPVCPNCHAVLHSRVPAFSIEEVRAFLR